MSTTDKFGNAIPFIAIAKDKDCPPNELGKGGLLVKKTGDTEIQYQLDVVHIARGKGDVNTSSKGWRYWGIGSEPKTEVEGEEFIAKFGEFFGYKYIASRLITTFNIENQRFCELAVTNQWPDNDLIETLSTRGIRGESQAGAVKDIKAIALELAQLKPGTPEHTAKLMELAGASQKLIS